MGINDGSEIPYTGMTRRDFIKMASIVVVGSVTGIVTVPLLAKGSLLLRPPGSIEEKPFLASCIKCGQCVQICPVHAIRLSDFNNGLINIGTPYINARAGACDFSCTGVQCVLACPTGALDHRIAKKPDEVRIGLARLYPERCLSVKGQLYTGPEPKNYNPDLYRWKVKPEEYREHICRLCVDKCPIGAKAITMEEIKAPDGRVYLRPTVQEGCTGCGVCEMVCPVQEAAIKVIPRMKWRKRA